MKDFTIELTTKKKILEVNNSMCHNFYYLQHGRIYNADKTRLRRFKFVFWVSPMLNQASVPPTNSAVKAKNRSNKVTILFLIIFIT